jgi:plasmid stabilization system protein ParE
MIYDVIVTPAAENDIAAGFAYIQARSPVNAERWVQGCTNSCISSSQCPSDAGKLARLRISA